MGREVIEIAALRAAAESAVAKARRLLRLLQSDPFVFAYGQAHEQPRAYVKELIAKSDETGIQAWIKQYASVRLEYRSYREIRDLARKEGVPRWSREEKEVLIQKLREKGIK